MKHYSKPEISDIQLQYNKNQVFPAALLAPAAVAAVAASFSTAAASAFMGKDKVGPNNNGHIMLKPVLK